MPQRKLIFFRIIFALPVLRMDILAAVIPIFSASSPEGIFLFADPYGYLIHKGKYNKCQRTDNCVEIKYDLPYCIASQSDKSHVAITEDVNEKCY